MIKILAGLISRLRERSHMLKYLLLIFLVFALVFDLFVPRHHPHFWGDRLIGFWSVVGFFGCLAMIIICKGLYHVWLMKGEEYYDK